ncbi:hypothetical protein PG985_016325 [Apiospora marii]|uniref:uncharacterized protein n=1 Tax=Apiospora marii TaxID=335849 RepID=UPI003131B0E6
MHNRLVSQALCLRFAAQATCHAPKTTADTNRDDQVDEANRTSDKGTWTTAECAIFLPNLGDKHRRCAARDGAGHPLSNDELAYCSDASGHRTAGWQVFEQLRGPGLGGYQPTSGTGNDAALHYTSRNGTRYPAGRIIMGKHFDRRTAILPFLEAPAVQSPLLLETGWMVIGHVDEFVQFLPFNNSLGFTVAIAYARRYIDANLEILLAKLPLHRADGIRVPTLLHASEPFGKARGGVPSEPGTARAGEYLTASFRPASINGMVAGNHYITPRPWCPVVNGVDILIKAVGAAYDRGDMTLSYSTTL